MPSTGLRLKKICATLRELAPPERAAAWDNTGLLVEPVRAEKIRRILLTIDLSEEVLREAIRVRAQLVVAYHPPIFHGLTALTRETSLGRMLLQAVQRNVAVYSPHTALDAITGGVNDWLADGLGPGKRRPIEAWPDDPAQGQGRIVHLDKAVGLPTLTGRIRKHLGLSRLQTARAGSGKVRTVALCAGAGASVLGGVDAELYWTGEMPHHEVLAAVGQGRHVILCGHTNTERGYLKIFRRTLLRALGREVEVVLSKSDRHPLVITG